MKMSSDRGGFEKKWEEAFENAQITPQGAIWDKIESRLDASKNKGKRRFLFVKLAVAASLVFALSLAFYNTLFESDTNPIALNSENNTSSEEPNSFSERSESLSSGEGSEGRNIEKEEEKNISDNASGNEKEVAATSSESTLLSESGDAELSPNTSELNNTTSRKAKVEITNIQPDEDGNSLITQSNTAVNSPEKVIALSHPSEKTGANDLQALHSHGLEKVDSQLGELSEIIVYPMGYDLITSEKKKQKDKNDLFLAGLNFAAGTFDPGVTASSGASANANGFNDFLASPESHTAGNYAFYANNVNSLNNSFTISESESYKQSAAYSYGANVGYQISKRFIVYGGVNYTKANSVLNSGISITENGKKVANTVYLNSDALEGTEGDGSAVNNEYEFASVPLKAGYILVDSKLNLLLLTGISTEFLLNSSYSSDSEVVQYRVTELEAGKDENYNSVYFNGIVGLSLGYTFFDNYRLSVEPTLRKSLSSFLDNDREVGRPLYKMISFGVSYQF